MGATVCCKDKLLSDSDEEIKKISIKKKIKEEKEDIITCRSPFLSPNTSLLGGEKTLDDQNNSFENFVLNSSNNNILKIKFEVLEISTSILEKTLDFKPAFHLSFCSDYEQIHCFKVICNNLVEDNTVKNDKKYKKVKSFTFTSTTKLLKDNNFDKSYLIIELHNEPFSEGSIKLGFSTIHLSNLQNIYNTNCEIILQDWNLNRVGKVKFKTFSEDQEEAKTNKEKLLLENFSLIKAENLNDSILKNDLSGKLKEKIDLKLEKFIMIEQFKNKTYFYEFLRQQIDKSRGDKSIFEKFITKDFFVYVLNNTSSVSINYLLIILFSENLEHFEKFKEFNIKQKELIEICLNFIKSTFSKNDKSQCFKILRLETCLFSCNLIYEIIKACNSNKIFSKQERLSQTFTLIKVVFSNLFVFESILDVFGESIELIIITVKLLKYIVSNFIEYGIENPKLNSLNNILDFKNSIIIYNHGIFINHFSDIITKHFLLFNLLEDVFNVLECISCDVKVEQTSYLINRINLLKLKGTVDICKQVKLNSFSICAYYYSFLENSLNVFLNDSSQEINDKVFASQAVTIKVCFMELKEVFKYKTENLFFYADYYFRISACLIKIDRKNINDIISFNCVYSMVYFLNEIQNKLETENKIFIANSVTSIVYFVLQVLIVKDEFHVSFVSKINLEGFTSIDNFVKFLYNIASLLEENQVEVEEFTESIISLQKILAP